MEKLSKAGTRKFHFNLISLKLSELDYPMR
ncbi:hypothetical protein KCTC52924_03671 [Arenibacter antarcticus]